MEETVRRKTLKSWKKGKINIALEMERLDAPKIAICQKQNYAVALIMQNNAQLHALQLITNALLVEMQIIKKRQDNIGKFIPHVLKKYLK